MTDYSNCKRCRRALKRPESRKLGYGAVCWLKILRARLILTPDPYPSEPQNTIFEAIVSEAVETTAKENDLNITNVGKSIVTRAITNALKETFD